MKLLSRLLLSGVLAGGMLALAGAPAQADDHWLVCPGTENTATVCVGASEGDASTETTSVPVEECVNITHPNCEVPVEHTVEVPTPVLDPAPSAEVYVECMGSPCVGPAGVGGGRIGY